ncbi:MAG: hypothetical protein H6Q65_269 [Firmicutes bacterium]|nr:hypothetical protein [Bacillota bacterium]
MVYCPLRKHSQQKGSAAILAVFVMALLGTIGTAYIALSSTEMKTATSFRDGVAAQCFAEAGTKLAMLKLSQNPGWIPSPSPFVENLGTIPTAGRYEVTVANNGGNKRTVTSIGIVNKARRQVVLVLDTGVPTVSPATILSWNNY